MSKCKKTGLALHPTNKIKITAEKIEELKKENWMDEGNYEFTVQKKINELIEAVNNITNTTN